MSTASSPKPDASIPLAGAVAGPRPARPHRALVEVTPTIAFDPRAGELGRLRADLARLREDYERIVELAEVNTNQQDLVKARIKRLEKADRRSEGKP